MSVAVGSSRGSSGSDEVEVSGRGRGIRHIDLPAVFATPQERELLRVVTAFDLSRNELQELTNLQPLRSLCRLNASYNRIHLVDGLPLRLTQLNLAHNRLEHLDHVGQLVHLRELDVSCNRLGSLAGLHPRVPLEVLRADDNRIDRTTGLEDMRNLRVVSLSNNYIEDLDELLFLPSTPRLQILSLTGNPVTRARRYRQTVAELQPALTSLDGAPLTCPEDLERDAAPSSNGASRGTVKKAVPATSAPAGGAAVPAAWATSSATSVSALDDSATAQRRERPPQPALRAADTGAKPPHAPSPLPTATSAATTSTSQARRAVTAGRAAHHRALSSTEPSTAGPAAAPSRAVPSPAQPPAAAAPPPQRQPIQATRGSAIASQEPTAEAPASPTPTDSDVEGEASGTQAAQRRVDPAPASSLSRTPEQVSGGRRGDHAALHASPSSAPFGSARRGAGGRAQTSRSPVTPARSAAERKLDSTTAQLHDSLVAKEQLEKECHALRQASRRAEGQLAEARRVISQQLAELSQLRLERDALRESEGAVLERLEKEKRAGRSRAAHHADEVATLQAQYERMKTFCETQLADTRRELAAERARLLRQSPTGNGGSRERGKVGAGGAAGERRHSPEGSTAAAAAGVSAELGGPPQNASPAGTAACTGVKWTSSVADSSASAGGVAQLTSDAPPPPAAHPSVPSAEVVAQQLTQWLYASVAPAEASSMNVSSDAEAVAVRDLRKTLAATASGVQPHPPQRDLHGRALPAELGPPSSAQAEASGDGASVQTSLAVDAAARRVLEMYIAQHIAATSSSGGEHSEHTKPPEPHAAQQRADTAAREKVKKLESAAGTGDADRADAAVAPLPPPSRRRSPTLLPPPDADLELEPVAEAAAVEAPDRQDEAAARVEGVDDDSTDLDTEVTVMIAPPPSMAVQQNPAAPVTMLQPPPPLLPVSTAPTRDDRVEAAKALLKGMESLFDE